MDIYNQTLLTISEASNDASKIEQMQQLIRRYKVGEFTSISTYSFSWLVNLAAQKSLPILKRSQNKKMALKIIEEFSTILAKHNMVFLSRIILENKYEPKEIRILWKAAQINPDIYINPDEPFYVKLKELIYAEKNQEELLEFLFCTLNEEIQGYIWKKICSQKVPFDFWKRLRKFEWPNGVSYSLFNAIKENLPVESTEYENSRIILHLSQFLQSADTVILKEITDQIQEIQIHSDNPKDLSLCIILIQKFLEPYEIADELLEKICKTLELTDFRGEENKIEFFTDMEEAGIFYHFNNLEYELFKEKGSTLKNCYESIFDFKDEILNESIESALSDPLIKLYFQYKDNVHVLEAEDEFLDSMKEVLAKKAEDGQ